MRTIPRGAWGRTRIILLNREDTGKCPKTFEAYLGLERGREGAWGTGTEKRRGETGTG